MNRILRSTARVSPLISAASRRAIPPPPQWQLVRWFKESKQISILEEKLVPESELKPRPTNSKLIPGPASNTRLDRLLTTMLHRYILPAKLPSTQRKFINNPNNIPKLAANPVIIEVDGYEHLMTHVPKTKMPAARPLLLATVAALETASDWQNLTRILAGYKRANMKLARITYLSIINMAGRKGRILYILDALRQVRRTGFSIQGLPTADTILHHLQWMAVDSDYAPRQTRKALDWARMLWELMTSKEHTSPHNHQRLHREPEVVGQLLHLAAARAVYHEGGKDTNGLVKQLATVLVAEYPRPDAANPVKGLLHVHVSPTTEFKREKMGQLRDIILFSSTHDRHLHLSESRHLAVASYMLHGLRLARTVVEPELAEQLEPIMAGVQADIDYFLQRQVEGEDAARNKDDRVVAMRLGFNVYRKVIAGKTADWRPEATARVPEGEEQEDAEFEFEEVSDEPEPGSPEEGEVDTEVVNKK